MWFHGNVQILCRKDTHSSHYTSKDSSRHVFYWISRTSDNTTCKYQRVWTTAREQHGKGSWEVHGIWSHNYVCLLTLYFCILFTFLVHSYSLLLLLALQSLVDISLFYLQMLLNKTHFYGIGLKPNAQTPTWRTRVPLLVWVIAFDLSGMEGPTNSYATASIAFRIIWPPKTHHYVKAGILSVRLVHAIMTNGWAHWILKIL